MYSIKLLFTIILFVKPLTSTVTGDALITKYSNNMLPTQEANTVFIGNNNTMYVGGIGVAYFNDGTWTYIEDSSYYLVKDIAQSPDGTLWLAASYSYLVGYKSEKFFSPFSDDDLDKGFGSYVYNSIVSQGDKLWIGFKEGLGHYDGNEWIMYTTENGLLHNYVMSLAVGSADTLWIGTIAGISYYVNGEFGSLSEYQVSIYDIAVDSKSNLWICHGGFTRSRESGAAKYDGQNWTTYQWDEPDDCGACYEAILCLAEDKNGEMFFGTSHGALKLDKNTGELVKIIPGDKVTDIAVDSNNVKWFVLGYELWSYDDSPVHIEHGSMKPIKNLHIQCRPNPFNPSTTIAFTIPTSGFTSLVIYNIMGQKVRELVAENMQAGNHSIVWDGKDDIGGAVSSGVYISILKSGKNVASERMLLMK
ncbi:FlgD immunoglobulin-like domain containing protein [Candidatus Latescibacterota bacterium]